MTRPMPEPPPILDGETWEDYVRRCRELGETIRQAEARLLEAGATPPEPTTSPHALEDTAEVRDTNTGLHGKPEALLRDVLALTRSESAREARRRLKAKRTFGEHSQEDQ